MSKEAGAFDACLPDFFSDGMQSVLEKARSVGFSREIHENEVHVRLEVRTGINIYIALKIKKHNYFIANTQ